MSFPLNVYLAAVVSSCAVCAVSLPFWRKWCLRTGLVDDPGRRKIHDEPTALAGGLAVMTGLVVPVLAASAALLCLRALAARLGFGSARPDLLWYGLEHRAKELGGIFLGAFGMLIVGVLDDKHELRPGVKFGGQVLVALLVAVSGARITLFVPSLVFSYAVTVLWILTVINAFNFMDNMNGLCAGLGAIGAWSFALLAAGAGQYLVALIAFLTFGSLVGFLPHNFPRARAFLGDAGSHLIGYLLAVLAILPHFYTALNPRRWAVLVPLIVLAVPLFDLAWVVLLRWRKGQPFYVGDTNHLSHRLARRGLSRAGTVVLIWAVAAVLSALALVV